MRRFKFSLVAGVDYPVAVTGDYFRIITGAAEFEVQPDTSQRLGGLMSGMAYTTPKRFNELRIRSEVSQDVEIMAGVGRVDDNRTSITGSVNFTSTGTAVASYAKTITNIAAEIATVNTNRKSVIIQNTDPLQRIYVGGAGVSVATGVIVSPAASLVIDKSANAAIFAVSDAPSVEVRTLEEI